MVVKGVVPSSGPTDPRAAGDSADTCPRALDSFAICLATPGDQIERELDLAVKRVSVDMHLRYNKPEEPQNDGDAYEWRQVCHPFK
jgi:hypothetical protein